MELKPLALKGFENVVRLLSADLEALPDEAYGRNFGGVTRMVEDIIFEVNLVNDHVTTAILGESVPWPEHEGWVRAPADFRGKNTAIEAFKASTNQILATIERLTEEDLTAPMDSNGSPTTRYQRIQFMIIHMWYHLGQLNFIQAQLGDNEWHWA